MAYKTLYKDIIFIEGFEESIRSFGQITYKKESLWNNQLKNLDDVKSQLADKAISLGANAIINFKYGQKNTSWLRSILLHTDDNVNWFGDGVAVLLEKGRYEAIVEQLKSK